MSVIPDRSILADHRIPLQAPGGHPRQREHQRGVAELVLTHFLRGEELAAELTARLAYENDYSLAEIYDALRLGVYGPIDRDDLSAGLPPRALGDDELLHIRVLDERLVRLAARLSPPPRRHRDPQALVLTTTRRGVAACLCHLFAAQGVPAVSLGMAELGRHRRAGLGIGRQFAGLRYVVLDGADSGAEDLLHLIGLLRQLHLAGGPFAVLVLGDRQNALRAASSSESGALTFVADIPQLMSVAGVTADSPLTARERAVLEFVSEGATNQQAASALGISIATVKTYLERAQAKLKTVDRASAVATAMRRGWI